MELKKHIIDEKTGISYTLCGDYYLPDLALPEEKYYELGRFGRAKFRYLQKCHKVLLTSLRTSGTLNEYLHSVDEDCEDMNKAIGQKALNRGVGSVDIVGAARSVLLIGRTDKERPDERILAQVKSNLAPTGYDFKNKRL